MYTGTRTVAHGGSNEFPINLVCACAAHRRNHQIFLSFVVTCFCYIVRSRRAAILINFSFESNTAHTHTAAECSIRFTNNQLHISFRNIAKMKKCYAIWRLYECLIWTLNDFGVSLQTGEAFQSVMSFFFSNDLSDGVTCIWFRGDKMMRNPLTIIESI